MKLNVAVLGCGVWGSNHVRVLSELDNANLVGVADVDVGDIAALGPVNGVGVRDVHYDIGSSGRIQGNGTLGGELAGHAG